MTYIKTMSTKSTYLENLQLFNPCLFFEIAEDLESYIKASLVHAKIRKIVPKNVDYFIAYMLDVYTSEKLETVNKYYIEAYVQMVDLYKQTWKDRIEAVKAAPHPNLIFIDL